MSSKILTINCEYTDLTTSQEEILLRIVELIKTNDKKWIRVSSKSGDGKTTLLNNVIRYLDKSKIKKIDYNIYSDNRTCIIDDIEKINNQYLENICKKGFTNIIYSCPVNFDRKIKCDYKFFINNESRLKYIHVDYENITPLLKLIEYMSFSKIIEIKNKIEKEIEKGKYKNDFLFIQKKIEGIFGPCYWKKIKNIVIKSMDNFPLVNINEIEKEFLITCLEKEWIIQEGKSYIFALQEILVLIIVREKEYLEQLSAKGKLTELCNKYFDIPIFQWELMKWIIKKDRYEIIKSKNIYTTSIVSNDAIKHIDKKNIIFNFSSVYELFTLLNNKQLLELIEYKKIFNNINKIIIKYDFSEDEILYIKDNFNDLNKLIIYSIKLYFFDIDKRIINYINWDNALIELNNCLNNIEYENLGLVYVMLLIKIIYFHNPFNLKKFNNIEEAIISFQKKYNVDIFNSESSLNFIINNGTLFILDRIKRDKNNAIISLIENNIQIIERFLDDIVYSRDRSNSITTTSSLIHNADKSYKRSEKDERTEIAIKKVNLFFYVLYLEIFKNWNFYKWMIDNGYKISQMVWEGKISPIYANELHLKKSIDLIRLSFLYNKNFIEDQEEESYGVIVKKQIFNLLPEYWNKNKKYCDFVTTDFNYLDFIKSLIIFENNKYYFPVHIYIQNSKINKRGEDFIENPFAYKNEIHLNCIDDNEFNYSDYYDTDFPLINDNDGTMTKFIHFRKNNDNEEESCYIVLSSDEKVFNFKFKYFLFETNSNVDKHIKKIISYKRDGEIHIS